MSPPPAPSRRSAAIRRVLWVVLWLNLAVAGAKLAIGHSVNSLGMVADGFHSLLDGSSNVIGLVGMVFASRPTWSTPTAITRWSPSPRSPLR